MEAPTKQGEILLENEDEPLAELHNVTLVGGGKGRLVLTNKRLQFETKGGLFSAPRLQLLLDVPSISSAEIDDKTRTLILEWLDENNEHLCGRLRLPKGDASSHLYLSLDNLLEALKAERERTERIRRQQAFVWKSASRMWKLVGSLADTIRELHLEDWDAVDTSIGETAEAAEVLASETGVNVTAEVHEVSDATIGRDAPSVLRKVTDVFRALGRQLGSGVDRDIEWGLSEEDIPGLKWRDIRCLFLFSAWYRLRLLWQQAGDSGKTEHCLSKLTSLSAFLDHAMGAQLHEGPSADCLTPDERVEETAQQIVAAMKISTGVMS